MASVALQPVPEASPPEVPPQGGGTPAAGAALEALYLEHSGFVWRNARRLGCDEVTADDVLHDVFLVVAHKLADFRCESSLRTWLFSITYRTVQRLKRDRSRHRRYLERYAQERHSESLSPPQRKWDAEQELVWLLSHLTEPKRIAFILMELEGMTSVEVGKVLGAKSSTVESRLRAARSELARMLEREIAREGRFRHDAD